MWGEGLVENVIWRGLAENVRIPSYGRGGLKLLKKPNSDSQYIDRCNLQRFGRNWVLLALWERQIYDASGGLLLLKPSDCCHNEDAERLMAKSPCNFYSG